MRKLVLLLLSAVFAAPAFAADLPAEKGPVYAPPPPVFRRDARIHRSKVTNPIKRRCSDKEQGIAFVGIDRWAVIRRKLIT